MRGHIYGSRGAHADARAAMTAIRAGAELNPALGQGKITQNRNVPDLGTELRMNEEIVSSAPADARKPAELPM